MISWRDIPAQVLVLGRGERVTTMLSPRFQRAIDRAARVTGLTDHHGYIGEWRRRSEPCVGVPEEVVAAMVARLEDSHDRQFLERLVRQGGWLEDPDLVGRAGGHQ